MRRVVDDGLARMRNVFQQQVDRVEDRRSVLVAENDQRRRGDLRQALGGRWFDLLDGRAVEIALEVAVHLEEQLAERVLDVTGAPSRPVQPESGVRLEDGAPVAGLLRRFRLREKLWIFGAEVDSADTGPDQDELRDPFSVFDREVDREAAAHRTA